MRLIIFVLTALWYNSHSFGQVQSEFSKSKVRIIPKRFNNRLWKRQDDLGYLEQCSILQFWDKQIGRVNVLAFFDSSWQFSHRQASMLRVLRERFDRTGFENIQFFAVNAAPSESQYIDKSEIEIEEETWKQISPSEAEGLPPVILTPEALIEALGPDIYFIQDSDELQIWPKLRAFRDQILVIDRCGRLTYQVIVPWSILHFPYVKAAILSTYKDEPCGHCQFQEAFDATTESTETTFTASEASTQLYNENSEPSTTSEKSESEKSNDNYTTSTLDKISTSIYNESKALPLLETQLSSTSIASESSNAKLTTEESSTVNRIIVSDSKEWSEDISPTKNTDLYETATDNYQDTNEKLDSISENSFTNISETESYHSFIPEEYSPNYPETETSTDGFTTQESSTIDLITSSDIISMPIESSTNYETEYSNLDSSIEESSTINSATNNDNSAEILKELSTNYPGEKNTDSSLIPEESLNGNDFQDEHNNFSFMQNESLTNYSEFDYTDPTSTPEEFLTTNSQTEINDSNLESEELLSSAYETRKQDDNSMLTDEPAAFTDFTENYSNYDSSTNVYNLSVLDSNEEFLNTTDGKYSNDYTNTTPADAETTISDLISLISETTDKLDTENTTEQQISKSEANTTSTMKITNSSVETEDARLKDSEQIESIDSRDVLKSRSTNARSVAPNDGLENNLQVIEINSEPSSEQNSLEPEYMVPIRIIMRAPHVDEYNDRTMKAHEYLVLKTGLPDYHGHLESNEDEENREMKTHEQIHKKSEAVRRTYGKDESPGLYGELADYWRNFGNDQSQENTQSSTEEEEEEDDGEDEQVLEQPTNFSGQDSTSMKTPLPINNAVEKIQHSQESLTKVPVQEIDLDDGKSYESNSDSSEDVDVVDEEAKSKLIAHYSKLLPWLYYVLAK